MDENDDNNMADTGQRVPAKRLTLPDELAEWVTQNQQLVMQVQNALAHTYTTLSEDQIWDVIAESSSPEYRKARTAWHTAEGQWNELNSPENIPLGPIGYALRDEEIDITEESRAVSQANFTLINEGLRQRPDLNKLLQVLLVQKSMVEQSTMRTHQAQQATTELAALTATAPKSSAALERGPGIKGYFSSLAGKLLPHTTPAPAAAPAQPAQPASPSKSEPAPS